MRVNHLSLFTSSSAVHHWRPSPIILLYSRANYRLPGEQSTLDLDCLTRLSDPSFIFTIISALIEPDSLAIRSSIFLIFSLTFSRTP